MHHKDFSYYPRKPPVMYLIRKQNIIDKLEQSRRKTAWMGALPRIFPESEIMNFFKDFHPVDCVVYEKEPKNIFSFIKFSNEQERNQAIISKKNSTFKGYNVVVNRSFNAFKGPRLPVGEYSDEIKGIYKVDIEEFIEWIFEEEEDYYFEEGDLFFEE